MERILLTAFFVSRAMPSGSIGARSVGIGNSACLMGKRRAVAAIPSMGPSNDRELAIALIVDRIAVEGRLKLISIQEVVNIVDLMMTAEDRKFLTKYIQWRMANPIVSKDPST